MCKYVYVYMYATTARYEDNHGDDDDESVCECAPLVEKAFVDPTKRSPAFLGPFVLETLNEPLVEKAFADPTKRSQQSVGRLCWKHGTLEVK